MKEQESPQEKNFTLDFNSIKYKDLSGEEKQISKINEVLGDMLYMHLAGISGKRLAEKIFDGGKVELTEVERISLLDFLNSNFCTLMAFIVAALIEELEVEQ